MKAAELLQRIGESIQGSRSFGPPFEHDGSLIIPVAYVFGGGGGGADEAEPGGQSAPDARPDAPRPRRPGAGAGFGFVSWPVGVYVVKDGDAHWRPLFSYSDLGLLVLGIGRLVVGARRRRRAR